MRSLIVIAVLGLASPALAATAQAPQADQTRDAAKSEAARNASPNGMRVWDTRRQMFGTPPKPDVPKPGKPGPQIG